MASASQSFSFRIHDPKQIYSKLSQALGLSPSSRRAPLNIPYHLQSDWFLCLFEAVQNAFQHGSKKKQPVRVHLSVSPTRLKAKISDRGPGFDLKGKKGSGGLSLKERGRGLNILRQLTDSMTYRRGRKENHLEFQKKILPSSKRYRFADILYEVSRRLAEAPSVQKVYDGVLDTLLKVFNVERGSLMIFDPKLAALKVVAARGLEPALAKKIRVRQGEGISGLVFESARPLLFRDLKENSLGKRFSGRLRKKSYRSGSFISAPLIYSPSHLGEETLGVINLTDKRDGSNFSRADLKLLSALAPQAAASIRIGHLIERVKEGESLKQELKLVREIQEKLLPRRLVSPSGVRIAGDALISPLGGGDYFDVVGDEKRLDLVVADVSGHHLASAFSMMNFRSAFRALSRDRAGPGELLGVLNHRMFDDLKSAEHFICVAWVRLWPASGRVLFAGAGSLPLLLWEEKEGAIHSFPSQGYPLGIDVKARYREKAF